MYSEEVKKRRNKQMPLIGLVFVGLILGLLYSVFFAFPVMWLWNWLMPEIFGLKLITFWQSLGICFLTGLLFRGNTNSKSN
jgi:hypothetical protein